MKKEDIELFKIATKKDIGLLMKVINTPSFKETINKEELKEILTNIKNNNDIYKTFFKKLMEMKKDNDLLINILDESDKVLIINEYEKTIEEEKKKKIEEQKIKEQEIIEKRKTTVNYTGAIIKENQKESVLNNTEIKDFLLKNNIIDWDFEKYLHHLTINLGKVKESYKDYMDKDIDLNIVAIGIINETDEKGKNKQAIALKVSNKNISNNETPHITIAVGPNGKPNHSNDIKEWKKINDFKIKAIVKEVNMNGDIIKSPLDIIKAVNLSYQEKNNILKKEKIRVIK